MKHLHFLVGGINSSSLEETTEAKWTSTGHEASERRRNGGDREGDQNQRKKRSPASPLQQGKNNTTSQRDLLEENSEALGEALRQT